MATVHSILAGKGSAVHSVGPDTTVIDALRLMEEHNIGVLVVTDNNEIAGIFSERDYARKGALLGRSAVTSTVAEIMTKHVYTVTPEHSMEACMALMTAQHVRHLPVVEAGRLAGMISIGDVVKSVLSEKEQTIRDLTNYIAGSGA
ncbi:MAG: CBS domain-containing protein [Bacteroidetes bacterium]|jgi:CBS domain-containing protein|nr:CBS domain-containing protein [Bacteroidota bacterium]